LFEKLWVPSVVGVQKGDKFSPGFHQSSIAGDSRAAVVVALASGTTPTDELVAFTHAAAAAAGLPPGEAAAAADALVPALAVAGWDTGRVELGGGGGRVVAAL
jgi:hypothetical protein